MKWRTTIPVRVVEGSAYVDTISSPKNHKFVSEDKLREGLDIYFGQESNKLKEGKDYTLTYNDAYKFTITFLHEIDADNTNKLLLPIIQRIQQQEMMPSIKMEINLPILMQVS